MSEKEKVVRLTLIRLGIKCDTLGYNLLVQAAMKVIDEPKLTANLGKLFAMVSEDIGTLRPFRVEANVQNAITYTFKKNGLLTFNDIFGMQIMNGKYKPSTAEFLRLIAEYYNLGLYKNEKKIV